MLGTDKITETFKEIIQKMDDIYAAAFTHSIHEPRKPPIKSALRQKSGDLRYDVAKFQTSPVAYKEVVNLVTPIRHLPKPGRKEDVETLKPVDLTNPSPAPLPKPGRGGRAMRYGVVERTPEFFKEWETEREQSPSLDETNSEIDETSKEPVLYQSQTGTEYWGPPRENSKESTLNSKESTLNSKESTLNSKESTQPSSQLCPCGGGQSCFIDRRILGDFVYEDNILKTAGLPILKDCFAIPSPAQKRALEKALKVLSRPPRRTSTRTRRPPVRFVP